MGQADKTLKRTARIAGLLYFLFLIVAPLGLVYVPAQIIKGDNASETAMNILGSETLFRLGILTNILGQIIFIFLVLALYKLLGGVNKTHAKVMVILVAMAVPMAILNEVFNMGAMHILKGSAYLTSFSPDQLKTLALVFLNIHEFGIILAGFFWGLWLFPFGYLVMKSQFLPKTLGVLLILGGVCYMLDSTLGVLVPEFRKSISDILLLPLGIGEVATIFYLSIKGTRNIKPAL